ncbi:hypothetical protein V1523DRAFT_406808 [Lipomyces doorenjongii]
MQDAVKPGKSNQSAYLIMVLPTSKELLKWPQLEIKPSGNQVEVHPWLSRKDNVSFCHEHDIVVDAYSPLTRCKGLKSQYS